MQNVMCTKSSPASASGWSYAFEITGTGGTSVKVIFAGTNSSIDKEKYALQYLYDLTSKSYKKFVIKNS